MGGDLAGDDDLRSNSTDEIDPDDTGRRLRTAARAIPHLKDAPPSLITRSLRGVELAVTETRDDNPVPGLSGSFTAEDAFLVSLKLHDYPDCELWENGKCVMKADVPAGATYLYDLKRDPRYVIDKPFHSLFFYLPRSALDGLTDSSARRARRTRL